MKLNFVKFEEGLSKSQRKRFAASSCSNRKFYNPSLTNILSQISPVHITLLHFSTVYYHFILLSECASSKLSIFFGCFLPKFIYFLNLMFFWPCIMNSLYINHQLDALTNIYS